jgi:hypothetical protein
MTTRTRMISSITLALIGLNSVPAIAQRDVCDYERRNNSGKDGYDEARYGNEDGHQDRYDRSSNYEYERNPRHLPAYSEERLRERDEYLSRSHDYDRFDRGYDSSGHQSSAGTNRSRFRPTSFERYRDNDTRTRRDLSDPFRTTDSVTLTTVLAVCEIVTHEIFETMTELIRVVDYSLQTATIH